jgi:Rod binding domain-containing protein
MGMTADHTMDATRMVQPPVARAASAKRALAEATLPSASSTFAGNIKSISRPRDSSLGPQVGQDVMRQFQSVLLRQLFEQMIPAHSHSGSLGSGVGSDMWRQMQVEQFATVMASDNILGLAK